MPKFVIVDASVLIIFDKIGRLNLLKGVYNKVFTTKEIADEYGMELPDWIDIRSVKDKMYQTLILTHVDLGEASAIALATELEDSLLLLDDLKARKLSKEVRSKFHRHSWNNQ